MAARVQVLSKLQKPLLTAAIFMLIISLLAGCSSGKLAGQPESVQAVVDKLGQVIPLSELNKADQATLQKLYDLDLSQVEDFALYTAPTNIRADEILVLKLSSAEAVEAVKAKVLARIEERAEVFKSYLPEQHALIENHVLMTQGQYLFLAITEQADAAKEVFRNAGR